MKQKIGLRMGSWNVCGFVTEERKMQKMAEQISKCDLDIVGTSESWRKMGDRMQS